MIDKIATLRNAAKIKRFHIFALFPANKEKAGQVTGFPYLICFLHGILAPANLAHVGIGAATQ
ncbi:hypothetical protein NB640_08360 [Oxalobacter vibrioformis]|uniref:Uncharacterized protein n=1 Tax=Oxalobacter vibrioformis TaxID=933080 RepID=A0A9E9LYK5_9BURK|nr:hypothetical protein [Oxalobacter vibrioformis]WAW09278.1 hypothetical protein NB640_08360 [Oxalobacter vibrioformis]